MVHTLPGKIATKRKHSQVAAIEIMSYLGLLVFPLWMGALIWAYLVPVKLKATVETPTQDAALAATVKVGDEQALQAQDKEA